MVIGICDDDKTWRQRAKRLLKNWFENAGKEVEVLCFAQGGELLEYVGAALDVLFLDIELGEDNGIAIARRVNEKWKHCQIVYLTNFLFFAIITQSSFLRGYFWGRYLAFTAGNWPGTGWDTLS